MTRDEGCREPFSSSPSFFFGQEYINTAAQGLTFLAPLVSPGRLYLLLFFSKAAGCRAQLKTYPFLNFLVKDDSIPSDTTQVYKVQLRSSMIDWNAEPFLIGGK